MPRIAAVAVVVARAAPRAAGRAAAGRRGLCLAHCVRQAGCASGRSDGGGTSRAPGSRVRRWLACWRGRLAASTRAALARSARTAPLHTTVDAGAPPAGAVPGLVRRRARVGGCSEAWRELYVRLDTKSAPWSDDNGPRLVFGWRWSEGVLPHHPERTTGRSAPVGGGHHCEAAPKGTYAALISRPRAVCRARPAPTTAAKSVRKLIEGSLVPPAGRQERAPVASLNSPPARFVSTATPRAEVQPTSIHGSSRSSEELLQEQAGS